jgi:diaminohydroxyphosphoribosylaminopyrimidine deaminase/5-amino-6-(5-phosphoribosylamino)uracil reductase
VDLAAALQELTARGTTRLLVEGGPAVWKSFSAEDLVDEAVLFAAGNREEKAVDAETSRRALSSFLPTSALTLVRSRRIGEDHMHVFRRS